jgi:hypothetical protein
MRWERKEGMPQTALPQRLGKTLRLRYLGAALEPESPMILEALERSRAAEPLRRAIRSLADGGPAGDRIAVGPRCPPVKVERTLTKALLEYPELAVESIEIDATSGCEYFRGRIVLHTPEGSRSAVFDWDCKWRAEQEGWRDWFGFPDQARAAREFGWDCFRVWEDDAAPGVGAAAKADEPDAVPA